MFCTSCGIKLKIEDNFCGHCGTKRAVRSPSNIAISENLEIEQNDSWMGSIWEWADENNINKDILPRIAIELTQQTELYLADQKLNELPKEIGQLTQLTKLYLRGNQLNELPKEMGQLIHLTDLRLHENNLGELPEEIVSLKKLNILYIDKFPLSKGQLEWINELEKSGCEVNGDIKLEKVIEWIKEYDIDLPIVLDEL
ncbi:MAG: zinc-ribbon domain-containing protein, partial [Nonlabens ulvanivorans]|uniref:leucine-rich repeat domain-containing protein n=1 Tax=Nonlabens ulvanivorans TaxID=906888 RepID=UPI003262F948